MIKDSWHVPFVGYIRKKCPPFNIYGRHFKKIVFSSTYTSLDVTFDLALFIESPPLLFVILRLQTDFRVKFLHLTLTI
jgi:hypothetical protein